MVSQQKVPASGGPSPSTVCGREMHGIDYVPDSERHGKPWNLFTLWFSATARATYIVPFTAIGPILGEFASGTSWFS